MRALTWLLNMIPYLDEQCWQDLKPHAGKIVHFEINGFVPLYFQIKENGIEILDNIIAPANTIFSGSLAGLLSSLTQKNHVQTELAIKGDLDCAKALHDTWKNLDLDWEGFFAKGLGGELSACLSQGLRLTHQWFKQVTHARLADLVLYTQDEKKLLPFPSEVTAWMAEVDTLRHDVERLATRIKLLQLRICDQQGSLCNI